LFSEGNLLNALSAGDSFERLILGAALSNTPATNVSDGTPMARANELWKQGRLPEAEAAYREVLEGNPKAAWALYRLGEIYESLDEESSSETFFARALALDPTLIQSRENANFWKRFKTANELLEARSFASAEPIFTDLLSRKPESAPVLTKLGRIASEYGRIESALSYYERAIAMDSSYPWGHIGKAEVLDVLGQTTEAIAVLEFVSKQPDSPRVVASRLLALRRKERLSDENASGPHIRHWPANSPTPERAGPRVAVVSWCLAHNPVGRAMVLAEVAAAADLACEIVGPLFPSYGEDLWPPLRDGAQGVDVHGFLALSFVEFMEGAIRLVTSRPAEVAWVSKPRLPSLLIGFLYKLIHGSSVVLDIDDDELAFFRAEGPLSIDDFLRDLSSSDWREPHAKRWTQLAYSLIQHADAITVCNPVLQRKFGGTIIRHARGEEQFERARSKRDEVRREFGFTDDDKVILFLGTPRRHKGVLDVARALRTIDNPRTVFCIVGTILDRELKKELEAFPGVRISLHSDQPYSRLAELNAMADLVCVLQDPLDLIVQSQTPAKLTDAIATGTTILATAVPPIMDMMDRGRMVSVSEKNLTEALAAGLSSTDPQDVDRRRAFFCEELSAAANAPRARAIIDAAQAKNSPLPADIRRVFELLDRSMPGSLPAECCAVTKGIFRSGPRVGALTDLSKGVNLVFFWKQNDSGIYGRRSDMLLQQFAAMPNIRRILHIDAPVSVDALAVIAGASDVQGQGRLVASNTINRFLQVNDDDRVARRSFVYRGQESRLLGRELPAFEEFPNAVETWLRELDMTENVLAWVCPVVRGFPQVQQRLGFSFVACDVIDDQRQWPMQPAWRVQIERNYRDIFARSNAAFANCDAVGAWLEQEGLNPSVVPNGMDVFDNIDSWPIPDVIARLSRPVVGYCGNLTQRIDWELIEHVAEARPNWSIVLIGEPGKDERCRAVAARPNVHMLGVLPYDLACRHIAAFDAAMIPHANTALSAHMNPLKLYVYRGLGVPVVSTEIANLDDFAGDIRLAATAPQFVAALDDAIAERRENGRMFPPASILQAVSWSSRASAIWRRLEDVFEAGRTSKASAA
jgi:glycosyltransferase involved in cell wall biosynthesis